MDVLERIQELLDIRGWSYYRLAKEMGMPTSAISDMFKRRNIPSVIKLEAICEAFGISVGDFFAEGNEPSILTGHQKMLLQIYEKLPNRKRELLEAYLHGLAELPLEPPEKEA